MMTGADAPRSMPDAPGTGAKLPAVPRGICQDNAVLGLHFDQRLWLLREQAMGGARKAELLTIVSAIIVALAVLIFTILSATALVSVTSVALISRPADTGSWISFALLSLLLLLLLGIGAYCILALAMAKRLFSYHYQLSWREMIYGDQTLLFAAEELHKILQIKITDSSLLKLYRKPRHKDFGQMLQWCACQMPQLRQLARNPEARLYAAAIIRSQQVFGSQAMFQQTTEMYIGLAVVTLLFNVTSILSMYFVLYGPRYIISRAVLVAFLDNLLDQPMVRLDALAPPDPALKTWWEKITAPWRG